MAPGRSAAARNEAHQALIGLPTYHGWYLLQEPRTIGGYLREATIVPSLDQFVVWIAIGLIGGSLAGMVVARERKGFGLVRNLGLGLIGAVLGGFIFRLFGLLVRLDKIAISLRDVVAAFAGSLLVLVAIWLWQLHEKRR